jgi:hypothetical protein
MVNAADDEPAINVGFLEADVGDHGVVKCFKDKIMDQT